MSNGSSPERRPRSNIKEDENTSDGHHSHRKHHSKKHRHHKESRHDKSSGGSRDSSRSSGHSTSPVSDKNGMKKEHHSSRHRHKHSKHHHRKREGGRTECLSVETNIGDSSVSPKSPTKMLIRACKDKEGWVVVGSEESDDVVNGEPPVNGTGTEHNDSKCGTLCDKEKQLDFVPTSGSKREVVPKTPTKIESSKSDARVMSPGTPVQDEPSNGPLLPTASVKSKPNAETMEPSTPVMDEPNGPPFSMPCNVVKSGSDAIITQQPKPNDAQVGEHKEGENDSVETFADPGTPTMDEPVYDSGFSTSDGGMQIPVSGTEQYGYGESSEDRKMLEATTIENVESGNETKCDVSSVSQADNCTNSKLANDEESMDVDTEVPSRNDFDRTDDVLEEQGRSLPQNESVDSNTEASLPKTDEDTPMDTNSFQSEPKECESIEEEQETTKQSELSSVGNKEDCGTENLLSAQTSTRESLMEIATVDPSVDVGNFLENITTDSKSEQKTTPGKQEKYEECSVTKHDEQENIQSDSNLANELDTTDQTKEKYPIPTNATNEKAKESKDDLKELQHIAGNEKEPKKVESSTEHEKKDLKQDQAAVADTGKKSPVTEDKEDKYGSTESRNKTEVSKSSPIKEKETEKKRESSKIVDKSHSKDPSKSLSSEKSKSGSSDKTSGSSKSSSSSSSRRSSSSKTSSHQKHDKVSSGKCS